MPDTSHCCCPAGGSYCLTLNRPCASGPAPGEAVTVTAPSAAATAYTTDGSGQFCFTPAETGLHAITSTPTATGAKATTWYVSLTAGASGSGSLTYDTDPAYWCPCGCGLVARPTSFLFRAFGRTVAATLDTVTNLYGATMTAVPVYDASGPDGTTVDVGFQAQPAGACIMSASWNIPGQGNTTNSFYLGAGADVACSPLSIGSQSGLSLGPKSGDARWPGPLPSALSFEGS